MPIGAILWSLLPTAINLGAQALTKPKKKDYMPRIGYIKNYISNLRADQRRGDVYRMAVNPALRQAGAQGRKIQRDVEARAARSGLSGSGIEAAQSLKGREAVLGSMERIGEKGAQMQATENRRIGREIDKQQMFINRLNEEFDLAKTQHKRQMIQTAAQGAADVAGTVGKQVMAKQAQEKISQQLDQTLTNLDEATATEIQNLQGITDADKLELATNLSTKDIGEQGMSPAFKGLIEGAYGYDQMTPGEQGQYISDHAGEFTQQELNKATQIVNKRMEDSLEDNPSLSSGEKSRMSRSYAASNTARSRITYLAENYSGGGSEIQTLKEEILSIIGNAGVEISQNEHYELLTKVRAFVDKLDSDKLKGGDQLFGEGIIIGGSVTVEDKKDKIYKGLVKYINTMMKNSGWQNKLDENLDMVIE